MNEAGSTPITCPWCGTHYERFQPNCSNCGGSLPLPEEKPPEMPALKVSVPPSAPRDVPDKYVWRLLAADGVAITGGVFLLLGIIFTPLGLAMTIAIVTAFVGIPFALMGLLFLSLGAWMGISRYQEAQKNAEVLQAGAAELGQIEELTQNFNIQINGRHPWTITYSFVVDGRTCQGKVTTLSRPDLSQRPGTGVYVLYMPENPAQNTIYPHPYGYFDT